MRIILLTSVLLFALFFVTPSATYAQIVPCGTINDMCQTCDFIELGSRVLAWIVTVMTSICAIVIVIAGFKMVTAGGNAGKISDAKSMITNTIVGFIILLAAWLIVDTVMKTFVGDEIPGFGPWNEIQCVTPPIQPPPDLGTGGITPVPTTTPTSTPPTACAIPPLTPITDPGALQMEAMNGNAVIWTGSDPRLQPCANKFISLVGGAVTSAYRPQAYQDHLKQVHTRWCSQGLSSNTDQACSALKAQVQSQMSTHALSCSRPVATVSNHTAGRAIDVSSSVAHGTQSVVAAANASCLSWYGSGDPVHYTLRAGCTCN